MAAAMFVLLATAWRLSGWWSLDWRWDSTKWEARAYVGAGSFSLSGVDMTRWHEHDPWPGREHLGRIRDAWKTTEMLHSPPKERWPGTIHLLRISDGWLETAPLWYSVFDLKADGGLVNVVAPLWAPASAALLAFLLLFYLDRRHPPNSCPRCRYNLSATPPSAHCPECGEGGRAQQSPNAEAAEPAARTTP
jgi:hypothetical protein